MTAPWSAPDSGVPQPRVASPEGIPHGVATAGAPSPTRELPPPPLPLRPMTIPDLLDGAFAIVKRRPRDVLSLAAAFVIPIELLSSYLLRDVLGASGFDGSDGGLFTIDDSGELVGLGATLISIGIGAVALALLAGALGLLVDDWYRGVDRPVGQVIVATLRRSPALVVGVVLVHLLEAVGLIGLGVGAYLAMALLHVVSPVTTVEGVGPLLAIRRSIQLTSRRWGASLGVPALVGAIGLLVAFGFQLLPEVVVSIVPDDWDWLVRASGAMVTELVVAPFTAGVAVLYHLDLRIRTEGLDIERRAHALFDA